MIVDLPRFLTTGKPYWEELAAVLDDLEKHAERTLSIAEAKRFHYLYQRASGDLAKLSALPYEPEMRAYLEPLVARAYAEIHETREKPHRFSPITWFIQTFPQTFRRRKRAFAVSLTATMLGVMLGVLVMQLDLDSKRYILPFGHGEMTPTERVQQEEEDHGERRADGKASFSAFLMTHNIKVSIFAMALGMTFGIGAMIVLFSNGVIMGAICYDYILDGQGEFLAGWLLPHGSIEIPAILIAGQAGLVLGATLIGRGDSVGIKTRLRAVLPDLCTLMGGVAVMLVWAGIVEAFLSQYHEPVLPYWLKTAFGTAELIALIVFLTYCGRATAPQPDPAHAHV